MPKNSIQITKNIEGKPVELTVRENNKIILQYEYLYDDNDIAYKLNVKKGKLSLIEMIQVLEPKFIERISSVDTIRDIFNIQHIGQIDYVNVADTWVRPSSVDTHGTWVNSDAAFDGLPDTYAQILLLPSAWSDYLVLNVNSMTANRLMFSASSNPNIQVDVDVYDGAGWTDVYAGTYGPGSGHGWVMKTFTSQTVTQVRIRFQSSFAFNIMLSLYEILVGYTLSVGVSSLPTSNVALGKYENASYKTALASLNADGNLVAGVANKVIKLHALIIQATANVEGDIRDKSGGTAYLHFKCNDREGYVSQHIAYPQYFLKSNAAGDPLYVDFSTAAQCYFTAVYTDSDAS